MSSPEIAPKTPNTLTPSPLTEADYEQMISLWKRSPGVGLSSADERVPILRYLERNPGLSFGLRNGDEIVGTVLAGHDGRRGYLHHLAVDARFRGRGLGRSLVSAAMTALEHEGIAKCHLFVINGNKGAKKFWARLGWFPRRDITVFSKEL